MARQQMRDSVRDGRVWDMVYCPLEINMALRTRAPKRGARDEMMSAYNVQA